MSIITISRGSYSSGKEIAQKVAQRLGYDCISREALLKNSREFNIPEIKLIHAFEEGPSVLDRFTHGKEKYIAYIQAALLNHLRKNNIVYHGFAFHFFVKDIREVLKVRIISKEEDRIKILMEREEISRKKALVYLETVDRQRRKWSQKLYGVDPWDSSLYDLVIHIDRITVGDAVDTICKIVGLEQFQTTPESERVMVDLALAAEVKSRLIDLKPDIDVFAENGTVFVKTKAQLMPKSNIVRKMEEIGETLRGVKEFKVVAKDVSPESYSHSSDQHSKSIRDTISTYFSEFG